jgi:hypothetical protein
MTIKENLTKALEQLRADGWIHGALCRAERDFAGVAAELYTGLCGWCTLGILTHVRYPLLNPASVDFGAEAYKSTPETEILAVVIVDLGYEAPGESSLVDVPQDVTAVVDFNDSPGRTFAQVEEVFLKAIALAHERGL